MLLRSAPRALALSFLTLVAAQAPLSAQSYPQLELTPCGGVPGKPIQFEILGGQPGFPVMMLTSTQRAQFPLSVLTPGDPRSLGVGFDLFSLAVIAGFDLQGELRFTWPTPNDPNFAGFTLLHQAFSYPGAGRFVDRLSNVGVVAFELGAAWQQKTNQTMGQPRAFHTALDLGNGRHLVAGGGNGALLALASNDTSEVYDEATRSFTPGPMLTVERGVHTATRLDDGRFLLTGGVDKINDPQDTSEFYDAAQNAFVAGPKMNDKRMGHSAVRLRDGRVLIVGGLSDLNNQLAALGSALDSTEIYDPATNSFVRGPKLSEPKAGCSVVELTDGRILIAGGITYAVVFGIKIPAISTTCQIFDPATNTLSNTGGLSASRALGTITRMPDGRVLIAGGANGSVVGGGIPTDKAEIYDPSSGSWTSTGSMATNRGFAPGLWLPDGRFAVFGGANGTLLAPTPVAGAEVFDPQKGTWAPLPLLNTSRAAASATRMTGCGLLVIGGIGGSQNSALMTQEILLPN
jgi:hypothetical protein